jgi:hypothetical protein
MRAGHRWSLFLLLGGLLTPVAHAQEMFPAGAGAPTAAVGGPTVSDSSVGYIDNAIPGNLFRFRYDTVYNNRRPNRAEFFWARGQPFGPGVPLPEPSVDYQDFSSYLELAGPEKWVSGFLEVPFRLVNPEVNVDAGGPGDLNAGFKIAYVRRKDFVATLQLRTYVPTGDADRGLGTNHVSLEPGLLAFARLDERLRLESELRLWVPIGATDFAGDVLRYGVGVHYDLFDIQQIRFTPVVEFVGWTVLGGQETVVHPGGPPVTMSAAGDTILNLKLGMRMKLGCRGDLYFGYGRPLTGERWYENTYRAEFRLFY